MPDVEHIPIEKLELDPANIRPEPVIDQGFVESIKERGILQNLIVRPRNGKYGVVVGSRRFVVAKNLKMETVPCEVRRDLEEDMDARALSFAENEHREDIPIATKREIVQEFYDDTDGRKGKEKRVEEVSDRLNISRQTIQRYLALGRLSRTILDRLKKKEERSKSENKLLEKMPPGASEEKPLIDDRGTEWAPSDLDVTEEVPVKVLEKFARDDYFVKLSEENPLRAHLLATLGAKRGRDKVEKVLEMERRGPKERKKSIREEIGGPKPTRLNFSLGVPITDALDRWAEDHCTTRKLALRRIAAEFLKREGYLD